MNYIVFDLEWNQCPLGKEYEEKNLPFEIIEIGAVKLNEEMEEVDRFHAFVKPAVYKSLHFKTQEILKVRMEDFDSASPFPDVIRRFLDWCGPAPAFCTWGLSDLVELQRNMKYYNIPNPLPRPLFYYDVQKIFSIAYEDRKSRRALEAAVRRLNIPQSMNFHDALGDAYYTAAVLKQCRIRDITENYSIDYFRPPSNRKEEISVVFPTYSKFVSKPFSSKTEAMRDRKTTATKCYLCGKNAKRRVPWFSDGTRNYYSLSYCEKHGWLKGKIRIRKMEENKVFCIKTLKLVSASEAMSIQDKKIALRLKNHSRHHHQNAD